MNLNKPHIYLYSLSPSFPKSDLVDMVEAMQIQATDHFKPVWGIDIKYHLVDSALDVPVGEWYMVLQDTIDLEGANGYHWLDTKGVPVAYILAKDNANLAVTATHEGIELATNAYINKVANAKKIDGIDGENVDYLVEVADVTYADYGYFITVSSGKQIKVTDFYYPAFFYGTGIGNNVKYSHTDLPKAPRELVDGGYLSYYDVKGEIWTAVKAEGRVRVNKASEKLGVEPQTLQYALIALGVLLLALLLYFLLKKTKNNENS